MLTEEIDKQLRIMAPHQRSRLTAALLAESSKLIKAQHKLLEEYRRYHSKAGCPGPDDCYVCKAEDEFEKQTGVI